MSPLTGRYGEGVCPSCYYSIDLMYTGRLSTHRRGGKVCPGSRKPPMDLTSPEIPSLAFSSEPVTRKCPDCGEEVTVDTAGTTGEVGWRFRDHDMPPLSIALRWGQPSLCRGTGKLVRPECRAEPSASGRYFDLRGGF